MSKSTIPPSTMSDARFEMLNGRRARLKSELATLEEALKAEDRRRWLIAYQTDRDRTCKVGAHVLYEYGPNGLVCNNCGAPDDGFD